jgi:hypothetical protein
MVPVPLSRLQPSRIDAIEDWPWLDQDVLRSSRSRQVCMTYHFFQHQPGPECIPLLTCHLHQGLIAHGEHLTHRCSGWTEDLHRQRGWAPDKLNAKTDIHGLAWLWLVPLGSQSHTSRSVEREREEPAAGVPSLVTGNPRKLLGAEGAGLNEQGISSRGRGPFAVVVRGAAEQLPGRQLARPAVGGRPGGDCGGVPGISPGA